MTGTIMPALAVTAGCLIANLAALTAVRVFVRGCAVNRARPPRVP